MSEEEKITADKRILLDTVKEYSDHTTIHGINYVFASFLSFQDRLFWLIIFIAGLIFSVYLSLDAFLDWRKNMIVTRFENSELPVTEIEFPAVTICSQGLNMENVAKAVTRDFYEWHEEKTRRNGGREKRNGETLEERMGMYLKEKFEIGEGDPSLLEIIQSTTSVGGATAIMAESLTKNVKKCSKKKESANTEEDENEVTETIDIQEKRKPSYSGSNCPLMKGFKIETNHSIITPNQTLQTCIDSCFEDTDCLGYSYDETWAECSMMDHFGRFIPQNGIISGRKCTTCQILEWTKVIGQTLDKINDVTLGQCVEFCNSKAACSYYNFFYSKIPDDLWSKCILIYGGTDIKKRNSQYVISGQNCKNRLQIENSKPTIRRVSKERNSAVVGEHLVTLKKIKSVEACIDACHKTKECVGYEYYPETFPDIWNKEICNLQKSVEDFRYEMFVTSGYSFYVCTRSHFADQEAIGQNLLTFKSTNQTMCLESCTQTPGCVGYSQSDKLQSCSLKANIEYFQYLEGVYSGEACYTPNSYTNASISTDNILVSESPILSMVMTPNSTMECQMLNDNGTDDGRVRRNTEKKKIDEKADIKSLPNIDFLLNPRMRQKRDEYEEKVMTRLKNFFAERNSTLLYPNLFRLLWYTKIPCFDLFNMSGDHAHVLKHCEWSGETVPCENLFQAIPTDVGICCSFNFNSSMKETVYAKLIEGLKDKEMKTNNFSSPTERDVLKGKVGFEMGLKVAIDSHSNIASPATINSDSNAFQVYIGNPSEFPFLRNRAVQIQPGYENHVEVSGIKISADPSIRSQSVEDRKCQFYWESELEFHAGYSYTSCVVEFAMSVALRIVRCVPWYMPQNGSSPICGPWQTSKFQKIMGRSFSANHTESGCLPDCHSIKYSYALSMAKFRRCDQRNLNYSPLCTLVPKFSPVPWQKSIRDIYESVENIPSYVEELDYVEREYYPSSLAKEREIMESYTYEGYKQTYNSFEQDIAILYVYFGQPTTTEYIRVVSLSWVGFLAQAGGLIGACLGFSFISLVEIVYWFIIRFCRLSKIEKEKEKLKQTETLSLGSESNCVRSFEKLWCEGWESPCVETAASPDDE